jgi:transcriptional regulator with XRE-family HTH domain
MSPITINILEKLDQRRRDLGVPYHALASLSKLGIATVQRTLQGTTEARLETLDSLARALGTTLTLGVNRQMIAEASVDAMLSARAGEKAETLVGLAQGTAGLEGQAVTRKARQAAVRELTRKLLTGSRRKLWED